MIKKTLISLIFCTTLFATSTRCLAPQTVLIFSVGAAGNIALLALSKRYKWGLAETSAYAGLLTSALLIFGGEAS